MQELKLLIVAKHEAVPTIRSFLTYGGCKMQLTKLAQTMSSIDFLKDYINPARLEAGENEHAPNKFHNKIKDELDGEGVWKKIPHPQNGQMYDVCYLTHDQMMLVGMRESKQVRKNVLAKLNQLQNQAPALPATYKEALIALVAEVEAKEAAEARALHAEKTKGQISSRREAQVMGKLGAATKKIISLENKLQDVGDYQSILAAGLPDRVDTETKDCVQTWRLLKQISNYKKIEIKKVNDPRFGTVNTYHIEVINEFKELYL